MNQSEIDSRFRVHKVNTDQAERIREVRASFMSMANLVNARMADGRDKSRVMTLLEEASFVAVAGIAREAI